MFGVGVARCMSYERERVRDALDHAIAAIGGMGAFVKPGERVLIKPNLLYPRPAETGVTTHPEVVRALVVLANEAGASEIAVGDSPGLSSTGVVAKATGLARALEGTGARLVEFTTPRTASGSIFGSLELDERTDGSWAIINAAKAKTHVHAGLTLATKNCFGFVPGLRKSQWHLRAGRDERMFANLVVDIAGTVAPRLNVLDAIVSMEGNGPGSGTVRATGRILASGNPYALDEAAAMFLGYTAAELPFMRAWRDLGVGPKNCDQVDLVGDELGSLDGPDFERAVKRSVAFSIRLPAFIVRALGRHAVPLPKVNPRLCRSCGACTRICPPKTIRMDEGRPARIDHSKCISCFCCQEICPVGAITVKQGVLTRVFAR